MIKKEDFSCPKCRHKNRVKIIETVEKDKIAKVIDKSIFKQECKKCHEIISVEYPPTKLKFKYFSFLELYLILSKSSIFFISN